MHLPANEFITELLELEISLIGKDIKKLSGIPNTWRLRVGDYRIILEIVKSEAIILALHIGHRREIYR
ncbi:type II toxin-antitoxin system RelE family toxin [Pelosinus fermentans]|uniref:type II toxin-antitoxin system RelE family toxin n=1 Tax=Pelosinus fermentans TaxID=365349 RepID=UPI0009EEDA6A|nr:type II toxin-antitoxin system RelE/ParE family toxin [Pelosinus fermentans]